MSSLVRPWTIHDMCRRSHKRRAQEAEEEAPVVRRAVTTSFRRDAYRVTLRHRTLDDFPMQHGVADAVRMLERRRQEQQTHKRSMASTRCESKSLSSYSRRRFDAALSARRGEPVPAPSVDVESPLFYKEPQPTWLRPRLSVASYAGRDEKQPHPLSARPESEPPLRTWTGKTFDHTRGRPEAYPGIKQLVKDYNSGLRVVCRGNSNCVEAWESGRASANSDVLLLPLEEPAMEKEESVMSRLSLHDDEEEEVGGHREGSGAGGMVTDRSSAIMTPTTPTSALHRVSVPDKVMPILTSTPHDTANASDEVSSTHSPSPPWRCWVDDATVSSVNMAPEEPIPSSTCPSPAPVIETPPTPAPVAEVPPSPVMSKKKSPPPTKGRKGKKPEPEPELVEPPPPPLVVEEVKEEVVEEVEVIEEEVEPVLPTSICPSSALKAHEAEVKLWLRKSSFSAARRSAPMFWS